MATITSATTGNFSAGATWVGGVVPGPADDAVAATGTVVTIDTDVTVLSFQQAGTGKFVLGGGRTVTGNVIANAGTFTSGGTVEVTATTGQTATINGNVTGVSSTAVNVAGIVVTGVGTLVLNGSVTGSAGNASSEANGHAGVYTNVTGTITINGTASSGGSHKRAIQIGSSSNTNVTITGNVNGGGPGSCFFVEGVSATVQVNGNVAGGVGGAGGNGFTISGAAAQLSINGNVTGGNNGIGILVSGVTVILNVTGIVTGGGGSIGPAIQITGSSATTTVTGNVVGGVREGITSSGNGTTTVTGMVSSPGSSTAITQSGASATTNIVGNITPLSTNSCITSSGASSTVSCIGNVSGFSTASHGINCSATANGVIFQGNLTDSLQGATAIYSRLLRVTATNTGTTTYTNTVGYPNGTPVTRVSPDLVTGMPATSNVRSGTVYGYNSELTGTVAIPNPSAVAYGAEVDNTTGTATLDAGSLIAVVGQQVAAASSSPSVV